MQETQHVNLDLIDFSSCSWLRTRFHLTQQQRLRQLDFLLDLVECNDHNCRNEFLFKYKLVDEDVNDHEFIKELISIHPFVLNVYPKLMKNKEFIYCKNVVPFMAGCVADMNIQSKEEAMEFLKLDIGYFFSFSKPLRAIIMPDMLRMEGMNRSMLIRLRMDLFIHDRELVVSLVERGIFSEELIKKIKGERELCLKALRLDRNLLGILRDCYNWCGDELAFDALYHSTVTELYRCRPIMQTLQTNYADNLEFAMKIVEIDPKSYEFCSERVRSDRGLALKILRLDPYLYTQFHLSLLNDREIALKIVECNPTYYYRLCIEFRRDTEFIIMALHNSDSSGSLIAENIPTESLVNEDVINAMIGAGVVKYVDASKLTREQVLKCVQADGTTIESFEKYMEDLEILRSAVRQTLFALQYIPPKYQTLDFILEGLNHHPDAVNYIPKKFRNKDIVVETVIHSPNFKTHTISSLPKDYIYTKKHFPDPSSSSLSD